MTHNNYIYIAVMALVSYAIRILPLTLIRKPIKNRFVQSFLYYVPYVTLAVMTFPAIVQATQSPVAGAVALVIGIAAGLVRCKPVPGGCGLLRCGLCAGILPLKKCNCALKLSLWGAVAFLTAQNVLY